MLGVRIVHGSDLISASASSPMSKFFFFGVTFANIATFSDLLYAPHQSVIDVSVVLVTS